MAYATSAPPKLVAQAIGGGSQVWFYETTDASTVVDGAGYFSNGQDLGMKLYGHVIAMDTDAAPLSSQIMMINAEGATVDLNNGVAVTATDSD